MKKLVFGIFVLMSLAFVFVGCGGGDGNDVVTNASGTDGTNGQDGTQFYNGDGEPGDLVVNNGDYYIDTVSGLVYQYNGVTWNVIFSMKGADGKDGAPGAPGADGTKWYFGDVNPEFSAKEGDFYINFTDYTVFVFSNGQWVSKGSLKGADGKDGAPGAPGADGLRIKPPMWVFAEWYKEGHGRNERDVRQIVWSKADNAVSYNVYVSYYDFAEHVLYQLKLASSITELKYVVSAKVCFGPVSAATSLSPSFGGISLCGEKPSAKCVDFDSANYVVTSVDKDGAESVASNVAIWKTYQGTDGSGDDSGNGNGK